MSRKQDRIVESLPIVAPGKANCLSCARADLRGGDNTCGLKELRDHFDPKLARMARSERGEQFECGIFRPLSRRQADHRRGLRQGVKPAEQGSLF